MKKTSDISITNQAFIASKNKSYSMSIMVAFSSFALIASLLLSYFLPFSLIVTVPIIVVPFLFALTANSIILNVNKETKFKNLFKFHRTYFNGLFFGGYRLLTGLLLSIAAFFVVSIGLTMILTEVYSFINPAYVESVANIIMIEDPAQMMDSLMDFMSKDVFLEKVTYIVMFLSLTAGTYFFIRRICLHNIKYIYSCKLTMPMPMRAINVFHKTVFRQIKKDFMKDYIKSTWFLTLIYFMLTLGSGSIVFIFFNEIASLQAFIISQIVAFGCLTPFILYYINACELIFNKYIQRYQEEYVNFSIKTLNEFANRYQMSPEDKKEMENFLSSQTSNKQEDEKTKNEEK